MIALTTLPAAVPSPAELAECADHQLTVEIAEAELHALHAQLVSVIEAAEAARDTISRLAGPSPSFLPQHLATMMNMGAGYFRHCKATLEHLFMVRNKLRREKDPSKPSKQSKPSNQ